MLLVMVLICIWSDYLGGGEMKEGRDCFSGKGQGMRVSVDPGSNGNSDINLLCDFLKKYLFIWLCHVLVVACGICTCGKRTLSCRMWGLVPWLGIEPEPPALGAWSLSHWTTREVPGCVTNCSLGSYFLIFKLEITVFTLPIPQECYQMQLKRVSEDVEKYSALTWVKLNKYLLNAYSCKAYGRQL